MIFFILPSQKHISACTVHKFLEDHIAYNYRDNVDIFHLQKQQWCCKTDSYKNIRKPQFSEKSILGGSRIFRF